MESKFGSISFGKYLQSIRLEKSIPLEAVSKATRIGMENLVHIENEALHKLPAEVFVKGYLRAYARAIGADGDEVLRRYAASCQNLRAANQYDEAIAQTRRTFWKRLIISLSLIVALIVLSVGTVLFLQDASKESPAIPSQNPGLKDVKSSTAVDDANSVKEEGTKNPPEQPVQSATSQSQVVENHILQIRATQKTWVKVIVDGGNAKRYNLNKDDHLVLQAKDSFSLLIGDARGVDLTINDKIYKMAGKKGQVITVQLP